MKKKPVTFGLNTNDKEKGSQTTLDELYKVTKISSAQKETVLSTNHDWIPLIQQMQLQELLSRTTSVHTM